MFLGCNPLKYRISWLAVLDTELIGAAVPHNLFLTSVSDQGIWAKKLILRICPANTGQRFLLLQDGTKGLNGWGAHLKCRHKSMSGSSHSYRDIFFKLLDLSFFEAFRGRELDWARKNSQKRGVGRGGGIQANEERNEKQKVINYLKEKIVKNMHRIKSEKNKCN